MNIRQNIDYSSLYDGIDKALAAGLPKWCCTWNWAGW